MKRKSWVLLLGILLCGCSGEDLMDRTLAFRDRLLSASECSFSAVVTADYSDKLYSFAMDCTVDSDGNLFFQVVEPETICGISGQISSDGGKLTFEDTLLQFDLLADGQLSPVSAPWVFLKSLRSGYVASAGEENGLMRIDLHDSYEDGAMRVDVWMNDSDQPIRCEILYEGKRILSIVVKDFVLV